MSKVVLPTLLVLAITSVQAQADTQNNHRFYAGIGANIVSVKTDGLITPPTQEAYDYADDYTYSNKKRLGLINGAIQLGYQFSENYFVEGQFSSSSKARSAQEISSNFDFTDSIKETLADETSLTSTQIADLKLANLTVNVVSEFKATTGAIYAGYRTSGNFYAKIKGGAASVKVTSTPNIQGRWTKDLAPTASPLIKTYLKETEAAAENFLNENSSDFTSSEISTSKTTFALGVGGGYKINQNLGVELEYVKIGSDTSALSFIGNYYF